MSSPSSSSLAALLPPEVKVRIACFMHPIDAGRVDVRSVLDIPPVVELSSPRLSDNRWEEFRFRASESVEPTRAMSLRIPERVGVKTHSVELKFTWRGIDLENGRIFIVQESTHHDRLPDSNARFGGGIVLSEKKFANRLSPTENRLEDGSLLWHPSSSPDLQYSVWVKVGSGEVDVWDFSLTTFIFDRDDLAYSKIFRQLDDLGALLSTTPWYSFFGYQFRALCRRFFHDLTSNTSSMDKNLVGLFREFQQNPTMQAIMKHEFLLEEEGCVSEPSKPSSRSRIRKTARMSTGGRYKK